MSNTSQYSAINHTILPLLYRIVCPGYSICYLIKDPASQSLLMFNPWIHRSKITASVPHSFLLQHIHNVEQQSKCQLTHIFSNAASHRYSSFASEIDKFRSNIKHCLPNQQSNLKPQVIGEISVCFINAAGYQKDYHLIGVTHITPSSTKLPVLFVDRMLGVCRIDDQADQDEKNRGTDAQYMESLDKVKYFPNQTFIMPGHLARNNDLMFAKAVISSEPTAAKASLLLDQKIDLFQKNHKKLPDICIPTSVMEEKLINPFLSPQKYSSLLGVKDRIKCFNLLKKMRKQWQK